MNKKMFQRIAVVVATFAMTCSTALADTENTLESSTIGTGIKNLANDTSSLLGILCITVGGAAVTYFMIRKSMADEQDSKSWQRRAITAVICTVAGTIASSIISLVSGYFK